MRMKHRLLIGLAVAVFVVAAGSFAYLTSDIWTQGHSRMETGYSSRSGGSSAPESGAVSSAGHAEEFDGEATMTVHVPSSYGMGDATQPGNAFVMFNADEVGHSRDGTLTMTGTTSARTAKIVVTHTPLSPDGGKVDVYTLGKYVPGSTTWSYTFGEKLGNMQPGLNEYVARAYDGESKQIGEMTAITYTWAATYPGDRETSTLDVRWTPARRVSAIDVLARAGDMDGRVHRYALNKMRTEQSSCPMGYQTLELKAAPTSAVTRGLISEEKLYDVGAVASGEYEGSTVYVVQESAYECFGHIKDETIVYHFIQRTDGSLLRADADATSILTSDMPWDGRSVVDGSGPAAVRIDGSGVRLVRCTDFCATWNAAVETSLSPAAGFSSADTPVYNGADGCFLVERSDGFLEDYQVDVKLGNISWLDGSRTNTVYTGNPVTGGCGGQPHHCNWTYQGDPSELERVGTTEDGLEVYQEKLTKAEVAAMSSGTTTYNGAGPQSLYDVYWSMARYGEFEDITPERFLSYHPAIYVKDPLGRLLYYQGERFGPAVECGKPVIYLYPERTRDISVYVEPTGGFTVTDPPYNDGWHVRSTPDSLITNYADGETYPYLFWEGHGDEYERPTRGFVVPRGEVHALLVEKLALLGLNDKESADFMEFWEPRLSRSPYVFVTFVDQPTFDTIAPLTVEPAPDSVIRVFMDYEPLDGPVDVEPLPIVTPVREGFSVVEWGGALHAGDRGMCPADVLLR